MKLIRTLLSFASISLLATSCASFSGNKLPQVADTPATNAKKVSLTYTVKAGIGSTGGGDRTDVAGQLQSKVQDPMVRTFNKSERFSSVSQGKGGAVHVDVDMYNHGNKAAAGASGFISGFSLFTIPGFATDNYTLTATARTASGKSRQYKLDDSVTTVFWLPMIVATPFAYPGSVYPKVQENMYRNLLSNMERDGLLPKAGN
ncbi:hypothetical protein [Luteolibacter soli]|uniref:Lipoprotein n=1 Tax=Luteolibacter soli TaxID=3135280 RepID=A0ABU9B4Z4_9BACT